MSRKRQWIEILTREIAFTIRSLSRAPGFACTTIITLAVGLGLSTAMFTFVHTATRSPLRFPNPDSLVRIWSAPPGGSASSPNTSWPLLHQIQGRPDVFASAGASIASGFTFADASNPISIGGTRITSSLLSTLGGPMLRGRYFSPQEEATNGPPVVLISPGFWRSALGGREDVVGHRVQIDGVPHEVIGIVAEAVSQVYVGDSVFLPRPYDLPGMDRGHVERGGLLMNVTARLRDGVTLERANAELQNIVSTYRKEFGSNIDVKRDVFLKTYGEEISGNAHTTIVILMAAVLLVLLISITNCGSLYVTRFLTRLQELEIRVALGASPLEILLTCACEITVLVLIGAGCGLALASTVIPAIDHFARPFLPRLPAIVFNAESAYFIAIATFLALVSLLSVPLFRTLRGNARVALTASRTVVGGSRIQSALVVTQIAGTCTLLIGATLLLLSYKRLHSTSPGFDPSNVATAFVNLPSQQYPDGQRQAAFFSEALRRIAGSDSSLEVGAVSVMPLTRRLVGLPFSVDQQSSAATNPVAIHRSVNETFFQVMRVPLRAGRVFNEQDLATSTPVCIINEGLAKQLFGTATAAISQTIRQTAGSNERYEIVGVVGDVKANSLTEEATDEIYRPLQQAPRPQTAFVIRSTLHPSRVREILASAVVSLDPTRALAVFQTSETFLSRAWSSQRLAAWTTGIFALSGILLAVVGLYGLINYWVVQRSREFGVRMSLGADRSAILNLVLKQGLRLTANGVGIGVVVYVFSSRVLSGMLFETSSISPLAIGEAAIGLFLVTLAACWIPARRATAVDPVVALRSE